MKFFERIKSSLINHKIEWIIIFVVIIIKSIADVHSGKEYYDKDTMIICWIPMEFLFCSFLAIQFRRMKESKFIWLVYFALIYFQELICSGLVFLALQSYYENFSDKYLDASFIFSCLLPRTALFATLGYLVAGVNEINDEMIEKAHKKRAARKAAKEEAKKIKQQQEPKE